MEKRFEYLTNLQYKVKSLTHEIKAFKTGEKYVGMRAYFKTELDGRDREIKNLKLEIADSNCRIITMRNHWFDVTCDMEKEHEKAIREKDKIIKSLEERALRAERRVDEEKDKYREKCRELYEVKTKLQEEQEKVAKLNAQINRNYENSSKPSSETPNHKKIVNNREKSGKKPGGQPGHKGHPRKSHEPTIKTFIPPPIDWLNNPDYYPTGRIITKQLVDVRVELIVNEYSTPEYRQGSTRLRVHADFPDGVIDDVNYGGSVRALAFLLNNRLNAPILKTADFLSELTDGELNISTGMICGLSKQFSQKTEAEQKEAFADLVDSPVMNVDFTSARVNGKQNAVLICATPKTVMYFAKEKKGHEGVKDTPVFYYQNILIHDHERTFYNYGGGHGECNVHPLRYLKGIMENYQNLKWAKRMRMLIQEMIHFWKHLDPDDDRNPDEINPRKVAEFEKRYDKILAVAKDEYDYEPPSQYNKDDYNLYLRLEKYKANHLLFLHNRLVCPDNNLAERLLRIIKRKQAQAMGFRSFDGLLYYCQSQGVIATLCAGGSNLYLSVADIFSRQISKDKIIN